MARVVFQQQTAPHAKRNDIRIIKAKDKSLLVTSETESLMQCNIFKKPKQRPEPPRHENAVQKMNSCKLLETGVRDLTWICLRLLSKSVLRLPDQMKTLDDQIIPFWTGFNHELSPVKEQFTVVSYAPVIGAKPADMTTVYSYAEVSNDDGNFRTGAFYPNNGSAIVCCGTASEVAFARRVPVSHTTPGWFPCCLLLHSIHWQTLG